MMTHESGSVRWLAGALLSAAIVGASSFASADEYPTKDVRLTVGFGPGGPSDIAARFIQREFEESTGHRLIIQNRPGAGGATAWSQMNDDPADGYHLTLLNFPHVNLQPMVLGANAGYTFEEVTPVLFYTMVPHVLAVRTDSPFETFDDFLSAVEENPGGVVVGGVGVGTGNQAMSYMFNEEAEVETSYIPFPDTSTAMQNLKGGAVDAAWTFSTQGVQDRGDIRLLAVAAEERMSIFPDVPTLTELGYPVVDAGWWAVGVPQETPEAIRELVSETMASVLRSDSIDAAMSEAGFVLSLVGNGEADEFKQSLQAMYEPIAPHLGD